MSIGRKAVSEVISAVLVVMMGIALAGTAYMWGMPIIVKQQDTSNMERAYSYFDRGNTNSLVKKIEFIAKNGGEDVFTSDVPGGWLLHEWDESSPNNNSLEFSSFGRVSNIAIENAASGISWISLTAGGSCPPESGYVGIDPSYVVCAKASPISDGYDIKYRVWFRTLYGSTETKGHQIRLVMNPSGELSSGSNSVILSRGPITSEVRDGKTIIITEIRVLFS